MTDHAFAERGDYNEHPAQGTVAFVGVDTVDVRTGASVLRNVPVVRPLEVKDITVNDIVSLRWIRDKVSVAGILGRETAFGKDPIEDTMPPPAPTNARIIQTQYGAYLAWDWPGTNEDHLAFFQVDARISGGVWGEGSYPESTGVQQIHFPRIPDKPLKCRVRAEDRRGNRSSWVIADGVLFDQIGPLAPASFGAESQTGGVRCTWSLEPSNDALDLAGFRLWTADTDAGANPRIVKVVGLTNSTYIEMPSGSSSYFNISAFDYAGNGSPFTLTDWIAAGSLAESGANLLANSDFTRDSLGDNWPDYWDVGPAGLTTQYHGAYGIDGEWGYRFTIAPGEEGFMMFPVIDDGDWLTRGVPGAWYTASAHFKVSGATPDNIYLATQGYGVTILVQEKDLYILVRFTFIDGIDDIHRESYFPDENTRNWFAESLVDDWQRVAHSRKITDADVAENVYIGIWIDVYNNHASNTYTIDFDQIQLEMGKVATKWRPGFATFKSGASRGVRMDAAGISSPDFVTDADGILHSSLKFGADSTYDLGDSTNYIKHIYTDGITVGGGGSSHNPVSLSTDLGNNLLGLTDQLLTLDSQSGYTVFARGAGAGAPSFQAIDSNWVSFDHDDLTNVTPNQHHNAITLDAAADVLLSLSTQALGLDSQTQNYVFAAPTSGAGVPTFRALVAADIPTLSHDTKLSDVSADDHHSQQHALSGADHTGDLIWAQIDSLIDATNPVTVAYGTSAAPGTAEILARRDHAHAVTSTADASGAGSSLLHANAGALTLDNITLDVALSTYEVVSDLTPGTTDTYDLGTSLKLWRKGWLSELDTIIFAENTITLQGGWWMIPPYAGTVEQAIPSEAGPTNIDLGAATPVLDVGDIILFRGNMAVEYMKLDSYIGSNVWSCLRNRDGSGPNAWTEGTPFAKLGTTGDGRIEMVSADTVTDAPRISILKQGSTYNSETEYVRMGNLDGGWGYSSETWGIGIGEYAAGKSNIVIDDTGVISIRTHNVERIGLTAAGILTVKDSDGVAVLTFDASSGAEITKTLNMKGNDAAIAIGATPPTDYNAGNGLWMDKTGIYGLDTDVLQAKFSATDGSIIAGAGNVVLDVSGVSIEATSSYLEKNAYTFVNSSGTELGGVYSRINGANDLRLYAGPITGKASQLVLSGYGASTQTGTVVISSSSNGSELAQATFTSTSSSNNIAFITDALTLLGGMHIGGTSLPGNDNLVVDGKTTTGSLVSSGVIQQGGVHAGWEISTDGQMYVADYGVFVGGVRAGTVADPGTGNISVQNHLATGGDARIGSGIIAGSTSTDISTGNIVARATDAGTYGGFAIDMGSASGGWARGYNFYDGSNLGGFGAYGDASANTITYWYIGSTWTTSLLRAYRASNYISVHSLSVGDTTDHGDLNLGVLGDYKNRDNGGYWRTGGIVIPLTAGIANSVFNGTTGRAAGTYVVDANVQFSGIQTGMKGAFVRMTVKWASASATNTNGCCVLLRSRSGSGGAIVIRAHGQANWNFDDSGFCACNSSGDMEVVVAGAYNAVVYLELHGYLL